ncbi:MAG: zf-HC2 domain-containing protein [Bryobacteraceae bacterium]|nr:zf-HC2 domain-containing protein [Bryobacteraceae bacterium]
MKPSECKDVFAMLSQYLDRELPDDICQHIDAHISGCPPCVQFVESLRKTIALCRGLPPEKGPGPLKEAARDQLLASYRRLLESRGR